MTFSGEVIKPGDIKCVLGEGMPQYRNPFEKGRLIIKFNIVFPVDNWLAPDKIKKLEKVLPPRTELMIPDGAEECDLQEYDPHQNQRRRGDIYDEDDEEGNGPRVQCASH